METPDALVLVSGGFDPYHDGHAEYIQKAAAFGPVVVALNSDAWLTRKKGSSFMSWEARRKIMLSVKGVVGVHPVKDDDGTVCEAIRALRPTIFAKGGDRTIDNTPEVHLCRQLGIKMMFGLGEKKNSSSELIARTWGTYEVLYEDEHFKVKKLVVKPKNSTSKQRHDKRSEVWVYPSGRVEKIQQREWHQLSNPANDPLEVIEVQTGTYFGEDDIERK